MIEPFKLVFRLVRSIFRRDPQLILENLALRHQLQIALRSHPRPRLSNRDRFLWVCIRRVCPGLWERYLVVVRPETVIGWHRRGWRLYWTWRSRSRVGRPWLAPEVRDLIGQTASEDPTWGTQRIRGELMKLGIAASARSIRRYRSPTTSRPPSQTWRTKRMASGHRICWWSTRSASGRCVSCSLSATPASAPPASRTGGYSSRRRPGPADRARSSLRCRSGHRALQ